MQHVHVLVHKTSLNLSQTVGIWLGQYKVAEHQAKYPEWLEAKVLLGEKEACLREESARLQTKMEKVCVNAKLDQFPLKKLKT